MFAWSQALYRFTHHQRGFTGIMIMQVGMFVFAATILLFNILGAYTDILKMDHMFENKDRIILSYDAQNKELNSYFYSVDRINNLKNYYNAFCSNENIEVYEIINQGWEIRVEDFRGDQMFFDNYKYGMLEEVHETNGEQFVGPSNLCISLNVIPEYNLKVQEGRLFQEADMELSDDRVPMILGSGYEGLYQVGEVLQGIFLGVPLEIEIVGILEKNSVISRNDEIVYLDYSTLSPAWNISFAPVPSEMFFQGALYLDKISSEIVLKDGYTYGDFVNFMEPLRISNNIENINVIGRSYFELGALRIATYTNFKVIAGGLLIFVLFQVLCSIGMYLYHFYKNRYSYSVYILMGCPYRTVCLMSSLESSLIYISGMALGLYAATYVVQYYTKFLIIMAAFNVAIWLLINRIQYWCMKRTSVELVLRGKEV